ncbi:MAG TPA: hypothetical protein VN851_21470, partial [Thermoanaerobaculia bacterium]|nr:hypothetical protein [Thermoanaerobaculia bacterium]
NDFTSVIDPGGLVFPVAAPSWRELPVIPEKSDERLSFLEGHAITASSPLALSRCRMFLRISADHWFERAISTQRWQELTMGQPGRPGAGGEETWSFRPDGLLDDDDGDGDFLDPGELNAQGPGAEVEIFCAEAAGAGAGS